MPRQVLPELENLHRQVQGIVAYYRRMLDDDFLFGAGIQIPQAATIFDRVAELPLVFQNEQLNLTELLTLITFRYGLQNIEVIGHGGYAIAFGQSATSAPFHEARRVVRLVPENHVRNIIASSADAPIFDIRLNEEKEPIRDEHYPLLLSDIFLMPRHTTRLIFKREDDQLVQAGGYPATLHCQLLPEIHPFHKPGLDQRMAQEAGELLAAAMATLGVSVADAHGGNGGAMIGSDGKPITREMQLPSGKKKLQYVPVVLDYGYYSMIGARTLAEILIQQGVTAQMVNQCLSNHGRSQVFESTPLSSQTLAKLIEESGLPRHVFGRILYQSMQGALDPLIWIEQAEHHWQTAKEKTYPALKTQSRLSRLYPEYDEVLFPQRIEEYTFTI